MAQHPEIADCKVFDGSDKPLGRSFGIKLWPTLIALRDGKELARLVRPTTRQAISLLLAAMAAPAAR